MTFTTRVSETQRRLRETINIIHLQTLQHFTFLVRMTIIFLMFKTQNIKNKNTRRQLLTLMQQWTLTKDTIFTLIITRIIVTTVLVTLQEQIKTILRILFTTRPFTLPRLRRWLRHQIKMTRTIYLHRITQIITNVVIMITIPTLLKIEVTLRTKRKITVLMIPVTFVPLLLILQRKQEQRRPRLKPMITNFLPPIRQWMTPIFRIKTTRFRRRTFLVQIFWMRPPLLTGHFRVPTYYKIKW